MPKLLTIWLTPKNYEGVYTIDWDLEVKWVNKAQSPAKTFSYTFHNRKISSDPDGTDLPIPNNDNTIIGGDEITVTINEFFYYDKPNQLIKPVTKKITGMKILGSNGDNNDQMVKDYINTQEFPQPIDMALSEEVTIQDQRKQMQVIVEKESNYFQFFDERMQWNNPPPEKIGYTYTNTSSDWGLCQLHTTEPSIAELWNWKANVNSGIHFLWGTDPSIHKFAQVKNKFNKIKKLYTKKGVNVREPNKEEFLKMLAQHYHKGFYYTDYNPGKLEDGELGSWEETDITDWKNYGDDFWIRFQQQ